MLPIIIENKKTIKLRIVNSFPLSLILIFLVFHFICITPVINFLCICPQNDPAWKCACTCSKCAQRRQSTVLSFHISPLSDSQAGRTSACESNNYPATHRTVQSAIMPIAMPALSGDCNCGHAGKNVLKDIKQLIPISPAEQFAGSPEQIIYLTEIQLVSDYIPRPLESPG